MASQSYRIRGYYYTGGRQVDGSTGDFRVVGMNAAGTIDHSTYTIGLEGGLLFAVTPSGQCTSFGTSNGNQDQSYFIAAISVKSFVSPLLALQSSPGLTKTTKGTTAVVNGVRAIPVTGTDAGGDEGVTYWIAAEGQPRVVRYTANADPVRAPTYDQSELNVSEFDGVPPVLPQHCLASTASP
jgi:hypothetical protein